MKSEHLGATTLVIGKAEYRELANVQNCAERASKKAFGLAVEVVKAQSHLEVK